MPSLTSSFRRAGRLVADQVGRLHAALEQLAAEVRAAIARAVGQATGEAAREALIVILNGPPDRPGHAHPDNRNDDWGPSRRPTWPATRPYDTYGRDPYEREPADDMEDDRRRGSVSDEEEQPTDQSVATQLQGRWSRAVSVGCQAASWWLRRHPGPFSLIAAASIGMAASMATLVRSPLVAGVTAVAASALGLLALADAARSATGLADQVLK